MLTINIKNEMEISIVKLILRNKKINLDIKMDIIQD